MSLSVACTSDSQEQRLLKQRRKREIITFMFKWIRLSRSGLPLSQGESLVCMLSCIFSYTWNISREKIPGGYFGVKRIGMTSGNPTKVP